MFLSDKQLVAGLKKHTCLQVCQVPFGLKSPEYSFAGFPADNLGLCQNMVPPDPLVEIIDFSSEKMAI